MSKKDYGEVICQAVDEIVRRRLEGITYDSTILCTIVDNSRKTEGIYTVSNNNTTKFDAYSNDDSYRINDNVYVQIPGGDWNEQKFILAKKKDKVEEPFIYKNPFASLVDITGNVIKTQLDSAVGLVANAEPTEGENITQILLWDYQGSLANPDMLPFSAYSRLGISASFQSWLSPSCDSSGNPTTVNHGDYGLKLIITTINENTSTSDQATEGEYELYLNCADMIGNPYDFQAFYHQEKVFDISQLGNIQTMKLYFYQKPGTFINGAGELISATDFLGSPIAPNLFVAAPYITLGYDVNEFEKEKVVIYTLNPSTYSRSADENYNKKSINLRWIHQDEQNDELFSVDDTDDLNYEIRWYRYELGHSSADEYSGVYWKNYARKKKENGKWQKWVQDSGTWIDDDSTSFFSIELSPDVTLQEEKIKAIVIYKGHPYRSNILTLTNEKEVVSKPTVDAVQALSIVCKDNTYGNYRIYGQNGSLLDMSERNIERTWVPYFKSSLDNQDAEPGILTEAESVEWIIPTERTMIQLEDSFYEGAEVTEEKDTKRIHIKRKSTSTDGSIANVSAQKYKIKSYYSQSYSDNIIQCKIVKDKITYTATKELTFGTAGTTGTDYTFILDFDKGITAVTADSNDAVFVTARLYDYENNEIDISDRKITWSWKGNDPAVDISEDKLLQIYPVYQDEAQLKIKTISCEIKRTATSWSGVNYGILQASMDWGDWKLIAYLPIPIRSSTNYSYISGTTQVIYNSAGEIIDCVRNPYVLYNNNGAKVVVDTSDGWKCYDENGIWETTDNTRSVYAPTIKYTKDTNNNITGYYLSPLSFYVEDACEKICVTAAVSGTIVWSQPILIMQNTYPSAMLNEWDGALKIDESKGAILAPRMVAGVKDSENKFSGIVLGNWGGTNSDNSLTSGDTGLYGFDKGEQTYAFKQDGTAFIGKSGVGRISFNDSEPGVIESGAYTAGQTGMKINLAKGAIDAHTFTLTAGKTGLYPTGGTDKTILIDTEADTYPLQLGSKFQVDWDGNLTASDATFDGNGVFYGEIHASGGELGDLTVTGTLTGGTISGTFIDAGIIEGGSITGTSINNGNGSFSVDISGNMVAESATLRGHVEATSGSIGGWHMYSGQAKPPATADMLISGTATTRGWHSLYAGAYYLADQQAYWTVLDAARDNVIAVGIPNGKQFVDHNYAHLRITQNGELIIGGDQAPFKVDQTGSLTATKGKIGGWSIEENQLSSGNLILSSSASGASISGGSSESGGNRWKINANGTASFNNLTITGGSFKIGSNFEVTTDGILTAKSGTLGDWTLDKNGLRNPTSTAILTPTNFKLGAFSVASDGAIMTGSFSVTKDGKITATSGTLGGWKITSSGLESANGYIKLNSSEDSTANAVYISDKVSGTNFHIQNNGYFEARSGTIGDWVISTYYLSNGDTTSNGRVAFYPTGGTSVYTALIGALKIYKDGSVLLGNTDLATLPTQVSTLSTSVSTLSSEVQSLSNTVNILIDMVVRG